MLWAESSVRRAHARPVPQRFGDAGRMHGRRTSTPGPTASRRKSGGTRDGSLLPHAHGSHLPHWPHAPGAFWKTPPPPSPPALAVTGPNTSAACWLRGLFTCTRRQTTTPGDRQSTQPQHDTPSPTVRATLCCAVFVAPQACTLRRSVFISVIYHHSHLALTPALARARTLDRLPWPPALSALCCHSLTHRALPALFHRYPLLLPRACL